MGEKKTCTVPLRPGMVSTAGLTTDRRGVPDCVIGCGPLVLVSTGSEWAGRRRRIGVRHTLAQCRAAAEDQARGRATDSDDFVTRTTS